MIWGGQPFKLGPLSTVPNLLGPALSHWTLPCPSYLASPSILNSILGSLLSWFSLLPQAGAG